MLAAIVGQRLSPGRPRSGARLGTSSSDIRARGAVASFRAGLGIGLAARGRAR